MSRYATLVLPYAAALVVVGLIMWGNRTVKVSEDAAVFSSAEASRLVSHIDPVCHMEVGEQIVAEHQNVRHCFCTEYCRDAFLEDPGRYLTEACLACRLDGDFTPIDPANAFPATWQDTTFRFCSEAHRDLFRADPAGFFIHTMWGIPNWLYYCSIALVLFLSFFLFEWRANRTARPVARPLGADTLRQAAPPRPRIDLLGNAWLRRVLRHSVTRFLARLVILAFFLLIIAAGLFGNQLPSKNIAPLLTWTVWWGGLIVLILYAGKAWCYVCPWETVSDWSEGLRFWGRRKEGLGLGLKWPKIMSNIWPATLLFVALTWVEIGFGVTMRPRVTAWLALAMVGMAFVCAFVFDRKSFCRYGCLVGRVSGLYALFSPVEIRARDRDACRSCRTQSCYRGGRNGEPCPTFQYLPVMEQNTYCISCMECLKSCEKDNVALQMRPWGEDLVHHHKPRSDEAYLAVLMLAFTGFHGFTMTGAWRDLIAWLEPALGLGHLPAFSAAMTALTLAPALVYAGLVAISRSLAGGASVSYRDYFIRYAYALLPIALFYHLAHNSEHLLMEGQKVVALLSDPFGWEWDLFGTATWSLPPLVSLPVLWLVQVLLVMVGHVYSLWVARSAAAHLFPSGKAAFRSQVPMLAAMILFSVMSLWLLKQPMEMRTSAM